VPFGGYKLVVDPKGPDFLHSAEDYESRMKRTASWRRRARTRIAAGAVMRYAIAPAMYLYSGYSLYTRFKTEDLYLQEQFTDAYGPILGPIFAAGADTITLGGLSPLPDVQRTNERSVKPMVWYMLGGS
jgi:hypothetical protein